MTIDAQDIQGCWVRAVPFGQSVYKYKKLIPRKVRAYPQVTQTVTRLNCAGETTVNYPQLIRISSMISKFRHGFFEDRKVNGPRVGCEEP